MPRLKARPAEGPVVDEPSVDRLAALMSGLTSERDSFLVLERLDRFNDEYYMQLRRDSLGVRYRLGTGQGRGAHRILCDGRDCRCGDRRQLDQARALTASRSLDLSW